MKNHPGVWPTLIYSDAPAAIRFLVETLGFTTKLVVPNGADETVIEHAQLQWPEGGGIMLGTANRPGSPLCDRPTGAGSVYVVTSDPAAVFARATAAGAEVARPLEQMDYGGSGFSVLDPEGNVWNFGDYAGE